MRLTISSLALLLLAGCGGTPSTGPIDVDPQAVAPETAPPGSVQIEDLTPSTPASVPSATGDWELFSLSEGTVARDGMLGAADVSGDALTIIYANNVDGEIEPCG